MSDLEILSRACQCYLLTPEGREYMQHMVKTQRQIAADNATIPEKLGSLEDAIKFAATSISSVFKLLALVLLVFAVSVAILVVIQGNISFQHKDYKVETRKG